MADKDIKGITVNVGCEVRSCKECGKQSMGTYLYELFSWNPWEEPSVLLNFDKETEEILINEELLMSIIQTVNPGQSPRKLKLVKGVKEMYK